MHWQLKRRSHLVYAALAAVWVAVLAWQFLEHASVRRLNREAMINRGRDITTTLGVVLRSQRRFGAFTVQERLEPALRDLIRPGDLDSIVILSSHGEPIVSAGAPMDVSREAILGPGLYWGNKALTLMNLVDLGIGEGQEGSGNSTTIVLSEDMVPNPFSTNRTGFRRRGERRERDPDREAASEHESSATNSSAEPIEGQTTSRRERGSRPPFGRPPWMNQEEYQDMIQKRGVHSFVIGMSTGLMRAANRRDLWMRLVIGLMATAAAGVSAMAWRNLTRSSELEIRLVKAGEMNAHLKQMNLAAAGLAHETRNPLNLIRGLAQMISRERTTPEDVRERSMAIMEEADRVTAQLNEFINFSRPREVRRGTTPFHKIAIDVARALTPDADDKQVRVRIAPGDLAIEADDALLRQVLFNLLLNAVQAVNPGGSIEMGILRPEGSNEAIIEVRDNGPGVPPDKRQEIFKPYFTTHQKGTGLGLAVVHQIVQAHGWDIACVPNEPRGAIFRISHVTPASGA